MQKQILRNQQELQYFLNSLLEHHFSGEVLLYAGKTSAKVYYYQGLITWAFSTTQQVSFQSILISEMQIEPAQIAEGVRQSRISGKKDLDDMLQAIGVTSRQKRREIVRRHTQAAFKTFSKMADIQAAANPYDHPPQRAAEIVFSVDDVLDLSAEPSSQHSLHSETPHESEPRYFNANIESEDFLLYLAEQVPEAVSIILVDIMTGMPILAHPKENDAEIELSSVIFRNIAESVQMAFREIADGEGQASLVEFVALSGTNHHVVLHNLSRTDYLLCLILPKATNLNSVESRLSDSIQLS